MENAYLITSAQMLPPNDLPFRIKLHKQHLEQPHYHDFGEIVCVLEGSSLHDVKAHTYEIHAGDLFFIPPMTIHSYHSSKKLTLMNILFRPEIIAEDNDWNDIHGFAAFFRTEPSLRTNSDFKARLNLTGQDLSEIYRLCLKMMQEYEHHQPGYRSISMAYFHELIVLITRKYESGKLISSRKMVTLSLMMEFIDTNYASPINRDDIIKAGSVSISSASRIFNEILKKSMMEYLIEVRINHASELLKNSDVSISDVAFRCGFTDSNYFSNIFHRYIGCSPRNFRKKNRNRLF